MLQPPPVFQEHLYGYSYKSLEKNYNYIILYSYTFHTDV